MSDDTEAATMHVDTRREQTLDDELNGAGERPLGMRVVVGFVVAAALIVLAPLAVSRLVSQPEGVDHTFVIAAGTADRLDDGEAVEILPASLEFGLADRLVVINEDDVAHQIGPFTIAPGEVLNERFADAVQVNWFCSLHPQGSLEITVEK